ncbi:MAG: 50S ribosomal protein L35 [Planctomycetota bacterium]|nr:50S ribosomal protein L35 [Planctomycetota bacterium]
MPKCKPCKAILKRVRITKRGKVVSRGSGIGHRKVVKSPKRKRRLRRSQPLAPAAARIVRKLVGRQ